MKLTELISPTGDPDPAPCPDAIARAPLGDPEIVGLTADSREVKPGFLFAALRGAVRDGRAFARDAAANGAVAILTDDPAALALDSAARTRIAIVTERDPQRRLALLAARFYPRQPRVIAAVTGTNGKTSVAHFAREIWSALGLRAASLGTLGLVTPAGRRAGALTTPDPVGLHRDLDRLAEEGIDHVAIEASSHGLAQFRLDGVKVAAAAFTNLTRDHLDYHGDMTAYRAAKDRLFTALLAPHGAAIINADSPEAGRLVALCRGRGHPVTAYGAAAAAELRLVAREPRPFGQRLEVELFGRRHELDLPLVGAFQAMNALAALGLVIASDGGGDAAALDAPLAVLPRLPGVPGRLQLVGQGPSGAPVFVDYAHTPDALATVLTALRPHAEGRLAVVFGAGGDRDRGKRPLMGRVAAELADPVYVTDDNPRSENPAEIRRAILAAVPNAIEIGDRRQAIAAAIAALHRGDLLVIAGKGHETGQIVADTVLSFDDVLVARELLEPAGAA